MTHRLLILVIALGITFFAYPYIRQAFFQQEKTNFEKVAAECSKRWFKEPLQRLSIGIAFRDERHTGSHSKYYLATTSAEKMAVRCIENELPAVLGFGETSTPIRPDRDLSLCVHEEGVNWFFTHYDRFWWQVTATQPRSKNGPAIPGCSKGIQ